MERKKKRNWIIIVCIAVIVLCLAIILPICLTKKPSHKHDFSQQKVDAVYLKSGATCSESAVYYLSCSCGEKGSETFTNGEALGHNTDGVIAHKDATCGTAGVEGGTYCTRCENGKKAAETVIPALNHNPAVAWTTADGKHYHACQNGCEEHLDEASCAGEEAKLLAPFTFSFILSSILFSNSSKCFGVNLTLSQPSEKL